MLRVIFTFSLCLTLQTLQILWILPKNGSRIWSPLTILTAACLVQVTIISILDYCNSFLTSLSIVYPQHGSQSRPVKRLVAILSSLCSEPTSDSFVTWSKTKVVTVTCKSQHDPAPVTSWTHLSPPTLHPHWDPCCYWKTPAIFPAQGLCSGCSLCLESFSPHIHVVCSLTSSGLE